jgi:hypothetical protein
VDTIIPEEGSLSPRLQAAIANFEARTSGLLLPSGIGKSITAAVEGATAIGETVGRFVQEIDEIDDEEAPHLVYHALSLIDKPERGEGTLRKRDLDGLLKAAGIEPGHNRTYLATFLYFHGYFNQDVATTKRHRALLPNSEARHYIREAIFNTTARLKRDEDIEAQAFISLTTEDNYDPFARDVPWAAKQAKKIFGNTRMPEGSDRFEELLAEEAGEPVGDSSTLTSSGELRTVSKRRFYEEDAGVLLGGDLGGEEKDEPVRAELERKSGVKYLDRRKGEGKKRGRSLETSSLDPRQARTYWILKYMAQRGTKRDKTFAALILQGYTPEDLSKMYDPNQTQNFKRKVGRWLDDKK